MLCQYTFFCAKKENNQLTTDREPHGIERFLVTSESCKTVRRSRRRKRTEGGETAPHPRKTADSLLTTTAALVDACPCTFVATAE